MNRERFMKMFFHFEHKSSSKSMRNSSGFNCNAICWLFFLRDEFLMGNMLMEKW